ncbi:ferredoxin [Candidatus Woesearchaeota archaeon]|jgi:ferredoxin|nr:ferredoxin [Candidatus Woesearchaeota archaeon]|tara:strand:+ start:1636 stop:1893 length:258 start_codon:yes stop_codon:yes gene_type:complete
MTKKYILQHNRPDCIGCAACTAVAPDFWEMNDDGKSDIKNGKALDNGLQELEIDEKDFEINKETAESCPVDVIHIVEKETKKKII